MEFIIFIMVIIENIYLEIYQPFVYVVLFSIIFYNDKNNNVKILNFLIYLYLIYDLFVYILKTKELNEIILLCILAKITRIGMFANKDWLAILTNNRYNL